MLHFNYRLRKTQIYFFPHSGPSHTLHSIDFADPELKTCYKGLLGGDTQQFSPGYVKLPLSQRTRGVTGLQRSEQASVKI